MPNIEKLKSKFILIPICPETLGGLPTPRLPGEIQNGNVIRKDGVDITDAYKTGAKKALLLAEKYGVQKALLKERSPSCGSHYVYDGTFSNTRIPGSGITASLLMQYGIQVFSEEEIDQLL